MDIKPLADAAQHGEGEAAAEVFAKLLEAGEEARVAQHRVRARQVQRGQHVHHAPPILFAQPAAEVGIGRVEGDADGDRFAVTQFEIRQLLEFVGRPVAKVERP